MSKIHDSRTHERSSTIVPVLGLVVGFSLLLALAGYADQQASWYDSTAGSGITASQWQTLVTQAPVPRYVVIDLGAGYQPSAINNSNVIVGGNSYWSPTTGNWSPLAPSSQGSGVALGINDAGNIFGFASFIYPPPRGSSNPSEVEVHACEWPATNSIPVDLDQQFNSNNAHNQAYLTDVQNGGLSQYSSWAYGGNSNGIYGISEPYATAMAAGFATNAPPYPLAPSVDNFGPHNGGPSTVNVAVSASHWFCDIFLNNSYSAFDEDSDITHLNSPFEPETGGVNTNGVGVGAVVNTNTWAAQPIALVGNKVVTLPGTGYGAAINNFAIVTAGSPPVTNPAPQIVGNDGAGDGSLWDYTAPNGTNTTVYVPKVLSQYLYPPATNAPTWTVTGTSGINDAGAIIGVATSSADNQSHGVLLLPCQFRLLNGSTNMGDVDGLDFSGNRATTISATASYTTPAFIATNVAANAGTNVLGVDTPLGYGRPAYLQAGNCDIYSLILLAKVSPSIAATITYGWNRTVQERAVVITSTNTNTWYVTAIPYPTQPYPDHPSTNYETSVPSTNNNVVAIYDNPGIYIPDFVGAGASTIGDYAYDKKTFIYSLTNSIGATNAIATQQVGCYLVARRVNITGSTVADWTNVTSISSTTNIPDCSSVTTNEIRAIVSPSTNLIMLDPSCTSNYPP